MIIRYSPFFLMSYQDFKKVLNYIKSLLIDVKSNFLSWNDLVNSVNENRMMDYIILQTMLKSVFCLLRDGRMEQNGIKAIATLSNLTHPYNLFFDEVDMLGQKTKKMVNIPFEYKSFSPSVAYYDRYH